MPRRPQEWYAIALSGILGPCPVFRTHSRTNRLRNSQCEHRQNKPQGNATTASRRPREYCTHSSAYRLHDSQCVHRRACRALRNDNTVGIHARTTNSLRSTTTNGPRPSDDAFVSAAVMRRELHAPRILGNDPTTRACKVEDATETELYKQLPNLSGAGQKPCTTTGCYPGSALVQRQENDRRETLSTPLARVTRTTASENHVSGERT